MNIVWFKRDLRIDDHHALNAACARGGPVLGVFVIEPDLWQQPDYSARQYGFLTECLTSLHDELAALAIPLLIQTGDVCAVLDHLVHQFPDSHLFSHEEIGNGWTYARDKTVARWCRQQGIKWTEFPQCGVTRGLRDRDAWIAQCDAFLQQSLWGRPEKRT